MPASDQLKRYPKFSIPLLFIFYFLASPGLSAQVNSRKEIRIPDIPGYLTLKCDLHSHTVFSDGNVWPTVRADEAWREGLDAIAVTEHIEYHPHEGDIPVNFGRSYDIMKPEADRCGLILIRGAEITRAMPPGHFNCLFLDDVAALDHEDFWETMQAAAEQGAFIFWNHPGWQQPEEIPIWYDEHTRLYENRLMHGIEIVNEDSYYPLAHEWCIDKKLTMLGNSDIHNPVTMVYDAGKGEHRPMTLVFATERTGDAIKEALFVGRTAVYFRDELIGDGKYLGPIFSNSVSTNIASEDVESNARFVSISNSSQVPFRLIAAGEVEGFSFPASIVLYPERTVLMRIEKTGKPDWKELSLPYTVENLLVAPGKGLEVKLGIVL